MDNSKTPQDQSPGAKPPNPGSNAKPERLRIGLNPMAFSALSNPTFPLGDMLRLSPDLFTREERSKLYRAASGEAAPPEPLLPESIARLLEANFAQVAEAVEQNRSLGPLRNRINSLAYLCNMGLLPKLFVSVANDSQDLYYGSALDRSILTLSLLLGGFVIQIPLGYNEEFALQEFVRTLEPILTQPDLNNLDVEFIGRVLEGLKPNLTPEQYTTFFPFLDKQEPSALELYKKTLQPNQEPKTRPELAEDLVSNFENAALNPEGRLSAYERQRRLQAAINNLQLIDIWLNNNTEGTSRLRQRCEAVYRNIVEVKADLAQDTPPKAQERPQDDSRVYTKAEVVINIIENLVNLAFLDIS
jgi:hypothetical protein